MVQDWSYSPFSGGSSPTSPTAIGSGSDVYLDCSQPRYRSYFLTSLPKMPGQNKSKGKGKSPAAAPATTATSQPQLSFVTATNPDQFRDKETMRQVRKTVMHSYLSKAQDDPNSTDVRVRNKRTAAAARHKQSPQPGPSASKSQQAVAPGSTSSTRSKSDSSVRRRDSHADDMFGFEQQQPADNRHTPGTSSTASSYFVPRQSSFTDDMIVPPQIPASSTPPMMQALPEHMVFSEDSAEGILCEPYMKHVEEAQAFLNAYSQFKNRRDRESEQDPFDPYEPLPASLNLRLLKCNCAKYFGSYAMAKQWVRLQLQSPEAYFASLCISAPYTDLMSISGPQAHSGSKAHPDSEQTLEILDIVPRMINAKLNDEEDGCSDSNIVAIVQLFCGQLSSQYTDMLASHPHILKWLINQRGGLDQLGGEGVIAMNVVVTNLEANVLQNQNADPLYSDWADNYLASKPFGKQLAPEGPLYSTTNGMRAFAQSKWCLSQTWMLVMQMHHLTETFLKLGRLESDWPSAEIDIDRDTEKNELRNNIRKVVLDVHDLPSCERLGRLDSAGWIYETIRLTSLLYSHAIWSRKPFHEVGKSPCTIHKTQSQAPRPASECQATPEMIQNALQKTPMHEVWDRLAGVLYWVLMVSASACHVPPVTTTSEGGSPHGDQQSGSSVAQEMMRRKGHRFARSGSVPLGPSQALYEGAERTHVESSLHDTWTSDVAATEGIDFGFNMNSPPHDINALGQAFTTVGADQALPASAPAHPFGIPGRIQHRHYESGQLARGGSPSSTRSVHDSTRGTGTWTTATHSGPHSGQHTPSPPSSVPSSLGGMQCTDTFNATLPTASTFDMSSFLTSSSAPTSNPFTTTENWFPTQETGGQQVGMDNSTFSWDDFTNTYFNSESLAANAQPSLQPPQQQQHHHQQATARPQLGGSIPLTSGAGQTADRSKRVRRAAAVSPHGPDEKARDHRAFVKRYLTANAVRVSILLRFEHTVAIVDGVVKLVTIEKYLNKS